MKSIVVTFGEGRRNSSIVTSVMIPKTIREIERKREEEKGEEEKEREVYRRGDEKNGKQEIGEVN